MEKTIKLLVSIAGELDEKNLSSLADRIDAVASNVINIKTAQYVGVQGYAVRNSRCFSNCYRKKRMQTPTKSAQEVWFDCHNEYIKSFNDDKSTWNKYAGDDSVIKTASVSEEKFVEVDKEIAASIDKKIKKGVDHGTAIFSSLEEVSNKDFDKVIASSEELLNIATELLTDPELAVKLTEAAENLVKEAGPMDFFRGVGQGIKNWSANTQFVGSLKGTVGKLRQAIQEFDQNYSKTAGSFQKINGLVSTFKQELQTVSSNPGATAMQKQYAGSAMQAMASLPQSQKLSSDRIQNYRKSLDDFMNSLSGVLGGNTDVPQTPTPSAPQSSAPQNGVTPTQAPVQSPTSSAPQSSQSQTGLYGYNRPPPAIFNYLSNMEPGKLRALINDTQTNKSFGSSSVYLSKESQSAPTAPTAPASAPAAPSAQNKPYNLIFHPKQPKNQNGNINSNLSGIPAGVLQYIEKLTREQAEALINDVESVKKGF